MAETVVINIEANTTGLQSTIDLLVKLGSVEKSVAEEFKRVNEANVASLNKAATATTKQFEQVKKAVESVKADNGLAKALDISKESVAVGNTFKSLKTQLKEATLEAQNLAEKFGELDPRTLAAAKRAGELKDKIGDVNAQIKALTPEGKFQAIQNLGGAIAGVFQVATGALQAFGVESEQATKIAQQFQGALNIFGGLSQLSQFKDSLVAVQSALGLTTVATQTQVVATEELAVAEGEATVAQTALNTSILANPYVIAAAALVALTAAVVAYAMSTDDADEKVKALNISINESKKDADALNIVFSRNSQERLNALDNEIKLSELNGKTAAEIGALKVIRAREELNALQEVQRLNEQANAADEKRLEQLKGINTEEAAALYKSLNEQILARQEANRANLSQQKMLASDFKVLEAEITSNVKKESEAQVKARQEANDKLGKESFDKQLAALTNRFKQERIEAGKTATTVEGYKIAETNITTRELQAQLDLYKKFGMDTTDIRLKLQEQARNNPIEIVTKFDNTSPAIPEDWEKAATTPVVVPIVVDPQLEENQKKLDDLQNELSTAFKDLLQEITSSAIFNPIFQGLEDQIKITEELRDAELEAIKTEEEALLSSYENRRIGKRELEESQKKLVLDRVAAEKKAEKELNELKHKQDVANRNQKLFDIALATLRNSLEQPGPLGALIPYWIGLGSIQAAAVLAQPLPKYKKGTLSVPGVGSEDSHMAMLQPGEAVIPTDTNRRYKTAIEAIYNNKIDPNDINSWVSLRLRGGINEGVNSRPVTAKLETADLYELSRMMKKNNGVYIRNMGDFATIFENMNNPRR